MEGTAVAMIFRTKYLRPERFMAISFARVIAAVSVIGVTE